MPKVLKIVTDFTRIDTRSPHTILIHIGSYLDQIRKMQINSADFTKKLPIDTLKTRSQ